MTQYQPHLYADVEVNADGLRTFIIRPKFGTAAVAGYFSKDADLTRTGAGTYEVQLPRTYDEIVDFHGSWVKASGAHLFWRIKSETVRTDGKLVIECSTEAGTATEPASGDKAKISITVSDSVLNQQFGSSVADAV